MKKKYLLGVLAALAAAGLFLSCSSQGAAKKLSFKAGTYTATTNGHNGPMTVETVFSDTAITSVKILKHIETAGIRQVINVVPERIVQEQSLAVDTVTGATFCGRAVIEAVTEAAKQAGGDIAQLTKPAAKPKTKDAQFEADVIVIGSGGAGLAAAVSAHQNGASVIVVEQLGIVGGSTIFSGGAYNAADPAVQDGMNMSAGNRNTIGEMTTKAPHDNFEAELQKIVAKQFADFNAAGKKGLFDSPEWHMMQTYNGGDYAGIPDLIRILASKALENTRWMTSVGANFSSELGSATGSLWQRSHYGGKDLPNGFHSVMPYMAYIEKNDNIEVHMETKAGELITSNGRVTGVKAAHDGAVYTYTARKGVIMATGGFGANVAMRQKYNILWDDLGDTIGTSDHRMGSLGDGITMGEAAGAQLRDMGLIQLHPSGQLGTGAMGYFPPTSGLNRIFVNTDGKRFVAEDSRRDDLIKAIYKQKGSYMWVIADRARYAPDDPQMNIEVDMGRTVKAETLEELAQKMEAPVANLKASIDEYNAGLDGTPDPFGLRTYDKRMGTGPFFAAKRCPTVHHTMGGLLIDSSTRVLDKDSKPIPGFYAAGEVTGGIHGANRLGGNALADCSVFGKIAGESAAASK